MSFRQVEGRRQRATGYRRKRLGGSLYKGEQIASYFKKMASRRVDWIDLGDSNEVQNGFGRNHGIQYAFESLKIPLYGVGLFSGNENLGPGSNMGYNCGSLNNGARTNDNAALPVGLASYYTMAVPTAGSGQFATHYPWFQSDAQSDVSGNNGFSFTHGSTWDGNAAWTARWQYARLTVAEGAGQFQLNIRLNGAPFTVLFDGGVVTTGAAADYSLTTTTGTVAAGTRDLGLQFRWHAQNQLGPVYHLYNTASMDIRTCGIQYSTMMYRGGQGMLEYAQCAQSSLVGMTLFISFACGGQNQGGRGCALFCINSGLNDRNDDGQLSVGPIGGLDSATPAGYADNARAVMDEIESAWNSAGYNREDLYFLLQPSHPISVPDDSELIGYRNICKSIADQYQNTAVQDLNFPLFANALYNNRTTWYLSSGGDPLHMSQTGYEEFFKLATRDLLSLAYNV